MDELTRGVVLALVSIVVGSLLTMMNDTVKWRRERRSRIDEERLQVYSEFLGVMEKQALDLHVYRFARAKDPGAKFPADVAENTDRSMAVYQRVRLLASPPVVDSADEVWRRLSDLMVGDVSSEGLPGVRDAQSTFRAAVRRELGI